MARLLQMLRAPTPLAFCLRLALLWSPLVGLVVLRPLREAVEEPLTQFYAVVSAGLLELLGVDVVRQGALILRRSGGPAVEIAPVCTGYFLFWLYTGAVLAFPASWASKLKGILAGALLIFVLNVIRILSLFYVLGAYPDLFDELHLVVWQSVTILAIAIAWYVWASRGPAPASPAA